MVYVGQQVVLKGTGRRWSGVNYNSTVVDIRESDNTVKVRYETDGGYKRYKLDELEKLVVPQESTYQFDNYELSEDNYDPTVEALSEAAGLRDQLHAAVAIQDFAQAHKIKQELQKKFELAEKLKDLSLKINAAVQKEDFLAATELQTQVTALRNDNSPDDILAAESVATPEVDMGEIFAKAKKRALGGGLAGATAMFLQVSTLMWMRTTMNYQYRYGTSTREAITKLYADGGIPRFYRGIGPALFQGPLSRFGDTAANTGMMTFLNAHPTTKDLPVGFKTVCASSAAASWRIFLMPIDTLKTNLQVEGSLGPLKAKLAKSGPFVMYHGALAACSATFAGHLPWFGTYNYLNDKLPEFEGKAATLGRNAVMGFCASVVSDTTSNSIRVVKTYRQTSQESVTYLQCAKNIVAQDGLVGLFGRGLRTRILANGVQGVMFSVLWKYFDKYVFNKAN